MYFLHSCWSQSWAIIPKKFLIFGEIHLLSKLFMGNLAYLSSLFFLFWYSNFLSKNQPILYYKNNCRTKMWKNIIYLLTTKKILEIKLVSSNLWTSMKSLNVFCGKIYKLILGSSYLQRTSSGQNRRWSHLKFVLGIKIKTIYKLRRTQFTAELHDTLCLPHVRSMQSFPSIPVGGYY